MVGFQELISSPCLSKPFIGLGYCFWQIFPEKIQRGCVTIAQVEVAVKEMYGAVAKPSLFETLFSKFRKNIQEVGETETKFTE